MAGTSSGGLKAAETAKRKFGENAHREWGAKASHKNAGVHFKNNPANAGLAGKKGGAASRRSRSINPDEDLRADEWDILWKVCNYTSRVMFKTGIIDIDDDQRWHADWDIIRANGEWHKAMTTLVNHKSWSLLLGSTIKTGWLDFYKKDAAGSLTKEEANEFRIIRNLATAWKQVSGRRWEDI